MSQVQSGTQLERILQAARQTYIDANPSSAEQHRKAASVMPGGSTRTSIFNTPFPILLARGADANVYSVDGDKYIDFLGEYTAGIYGHSHPRLTQAIHDTVSEGWVMGGHTPYEIELASQICQRIASIDHVRFTNSGTEANLYAITAAREITGKPKVMTFTGAYHGGAFMFDAKPNPLNAPFEFVVAPYNDWDSTKALLAENQDQIGVVILELMQGSGGCIPAQKAFVQQLRDWTKEHGAILIFDEVMTSRLAVGGYQSALGITPDMTTLGKYVGGGFSFGAFGGSADIMKYFDPHHEAAFPHAGTFNNNVFSMRVGAVGLRDILDHAEIQRINNLGKALRERLNALVSQAKFPLCFSGLGSMTNVHMVPGPVNSVADLSSNDEALQELFYLVLIRHGIWLARRGMMNISLPIEAAHCDQLVHAVEAFIAEANEAFSG